MKSANPAARGSRLAYRSTGSSGPGPCAAAVHVEQVTYRCASYVVSAFRRTVITVRLEPDTTYLSSLAGEEDGLLTIPGDTTGPR